MNTDIEAAYEANQPISVICSWCYQGTEVPSRQPTQTVFCDWCAGGLKYVETSDPKELIHNVCGPYTEDLQLPPAKSKLLRQDNPPNPDQLELF